MGDIDILACDYCEAKISRLSQLLHALSIFVLKSVYNNVSLNIANLS